MTEEESERLWDDQFARSQDVLERLADEALAEYHRGETEPLEFDDMTIQFYSTRGQFGFLSNFAAYPFTLKGKLWPTSEHYFQAQKFAGSEHEEAIRLAKSPMVAARMGRSRKRPLRPDWETVKDDIMREALRARFTQHPDLRERLLATGDAPLVEHKARDRYWADGGDGSGQNRLGVLLMELRAELRESTR